MVFEASDVKWMRDKLVTFCDTETHQDTLLGAVRARMATARKATNFILIVFDRFKRMLEVELAFAGVDNENQKDNLWFLFLGCQSLLSSH